MESWCMGNSSLLILTQLINTVQCACHGTGWDLEETHQYMANFYDRTQKMYTLIYIVSVLKYLVCM